MDVIWLFEVKIVKCRFLAFLQKFLETMLKWRRTLLRIAGRSERAGRRVLATRALRALVMSYERLKLEL